MIKVRKRKQGGFTLIELLMVILIVGILAAVGLPMYLGYARDARMSEAKAIMGSLWTSLRGCAQSTGLPCSASDQFTRIGVNSDGTTTDTQWDVVSETPTVSLVSNQYVLSTALQIDGVAGKVTDQIQVRFNYNAASNPPGSFTCSTDGGSTLSPC